METLYHQTNRILQEIEQSFQKLVQTAGQPDNYDVENEIQMKITQVNSNCDRLDVLLYKVPASQRQSAKMRVDQIKYDVRHLQSSLQMFREKRQRKQQELSEREQLLSHRFAPNSAETCLDIDYALQHNTQLGNAHRGVDDMIATGSNILSSLVNQRSTLKGAQKRLMAIGSTLGLSNHTMKLIERRFVEDKYVMLGGMFVTLVVIMLVIYFMVL
ncbi:probable Golgi SNAP receptor complex member 2 [Lucilia cuprina]|uniref:probable Golgi SNAP receptor complex member 2 n=1 Tax=Lucilia cuprina TaxID=7375 RepID=UPI000C71B120|nr:probable Golgi SNAP receptor complex member 2 [Lucilia cuprina]KAI8126339.1 putative Golgi SNAP receptor complex member 2 [Lucilia cuprina]